MQEAFCKILTFFHSKNVYPGNNESGPGTSPYFKRNSFSSVDKGLFSLLNWWLLWINCTSYPECISFSIFSLSFSKFSLSNYLQMKRNLHCVIIAMMILLWYRFICILYKFYWSTSSFSLRGYRILPNSSWSTAGRYIGSFIV